MTDIFKIPLYYIGFKRNKFLEIQLKKCGFTNINHFKSIDGRKMDYKKLLKDNIISTRAYHDLKNGRSDDISISSLGAIGCTLSHRELWKLCSEELPYIIIAEDDLSLSQKITKSDIYNIQTSLSEENGAFISAKIKKNSNFMHGTHLYFLTKGAAKKLFDKSLPISIQTDSYIKHIADIGDINLEGYNISKQKSRISSTADICVKCMLPKGLTFYVILSICILFIIISLFIFYKKYKSTKTKLDSCKSSCSYY